MRPHMLVTALLVACPVHAGMRDAEADVAHARSALRAAERAGALEHASPPLDAARALLARAEAALARREWSSAERAAEKALVDARLAAARTRQLKAEHVTAELEVAVETLRTEVVRSTGDLQP